MRGERMKSINRKILQRKTRHPENAGQLRVFTGKVLVAEGTRVREGGSPTCQKLFTVLCFTGL